MANHKEMDKKSIRLVDRFVQLLQLLIGVVIINGCTATKTLLPSEHTITKSKVNMTYAVDKSSTSIEVSTSDPVVLRTLIMQGFALTISGQYTYIVNIPSAKDVESYISHHPGEIKATMQGNEEKRPDIRPVLEALNKVDAHILSKAGEKIGKAKNFSVEINPQTGLLSYKITLSKTYSMNMPFEVNLSSKPIDGREEFNTGKFTNRNDSNHRQPFGVGQPQRPDDGQREFSIKYSFR